LASTAGFGQAGNTDRWLYRPGWKLAIDLAWQRRTKIN
jgi:hypothetical protein